MGGGGVVRALVAGVVVRVGLLGGAQGRRYAPWRKSQQLGGLVDVHVPGAIALDLGEQGGQCAECAVLGVDAVAGPGGDHPAHQPLEGGAGLFEEGDEAGRVGGVGVLTPLERDDACVDAGFEEEGDGGAGGLATGGVAIEAEHGRLGEAAEEGDLLGGEGRAEGGDGLAVAALVHGDDVDVTLDDDGSAGAAHGLAGEVEAEEECLYLRWIVDSRSVVVESVRQADASQPGLEIEIAETSAETWCDPSRSASPRKPRGCGPSESL